MRLDRAGSGVGRHHPRQDAPPYTAGPLRLHLHTWPVSPPCCHSHLQHSTDAAAGQPLQQLREVGKAFGRGLHLPLEPEPSVKGAWPGTPEALPSQARPSPRDPQSLSQILLR